MKTALSASNARRAGRRLRVGRSDESLALGAAERLGIGCSHQCSEGDRQRTNRSAGRLIALGSTSTRDYEFEYWKKALGISGQQLGAAVKKVGPMVKDVKAYLKSKR